MLAYVGAKLPRFMAFKVQRLIKEIGRYNFIYLFLFNSSTSSRYFLTTHELYYVPVKYNTCV